MCLPRSWQCLEKGGSSWCVPGCAPANPSVLLGQTYCSTSRVPSPPGAEEKGGKAVVGCLGWANAVVADGGKESEEEWRLTRGKHKQYFLLAILNMF